MFRFLLCFLLNLWQSQEWAAFQQKLGNNTFFCDDVLVIERTLPLGFVFFEIPYAHPSPVFWEKIGTLASEKKAIFARFSADSEDVLPSPFFEKISPNPIFPEATRQIDLRPSVDEIFAQFSSTGRRHVRIAEREECELVEEKDARAFAELSRVTAERDGFSAHSAEYFQKFLDHFGENAALLVAKKNDEWLSAGIFVLSGETAIYYYGASANAAKNAPTLLQFFAMQWARQKGAKTFDLLGIARDEEDKNDRLFGVSRFKKKFGGTKILFSHEKIIIFSRPKFLLVQFLKTLRRFFRRK